MRSSTARLFAVLLAIRIAFLGGVPRLLGLQSPPVDAGLQVTISAPKTEFIVGEPIDWTVTLKNISLGPLRIVKPDWHFAKNRTPAPPTAFVVERSDLRVAQQVPTCFGDDIGDTAEKVSVIVPTGRSFVATVSMLRCWSFNFGSKEVTPLTLIPFAAGRYRVSIRYGFPAGTYSRRWWASLGCRTCDTAPSAVPPLLVEEPWHGQIASNTVQITVK